MEKKRAGRKDEHHRLQRPTLPPVASVLISLPACWTHSGRPVDITPLNSLKTTLKGGHFYPRNADKKTEARVFLPKTMASDNGQNQDSNQRKGTPLSALLTP